MKDKATEYGNLAENYLKRAEKCLNEEDKAYIFYAALELRCGIEARLKEYFDAQAKTTKKTRKGWRLSKLALQVESAFKEAEFGAGERIVCLEIIDTTTNQIISNVKYIPVTKKLKKMGERLGELLHSISEDTLDNVKWWSNTRIYLQNVFDELSFSVSGELLGPPLEHPNKPGQTFFNIRGNVTDIFSVEQKILMKIREYKLVDGKF